MPGLRRLRDPRHRSAVPAGAGAAAGANRVRRRDRLRRPLRLLHEHLRGPRHPRPRPGARHRAGARALGPVDLGGERRRRRPLDRRQPPDPCASAQRADQDPPVQQPDLRPDEGAVLADQRGGQGDQVDPLRVPRSPVQPARPGARRRGHLRRANRRHRPRPPGGCAPGGGPAPGIRPDRDLPELQRLQRRGLRRRPREGQGGKPDPPRRREADPLRGRVRARRRPRRRMGA